MKPIKMKPITKRQIAYFLILVGLAGMIGPLVTDFVGAGQFQGAGPAQRMAMMIGVVLVGVGVTLWPFGNRPG